MSILFFLFLVLFQSFHVFRSCIEKIQTITQHKARLPGKPQKCPSLWATGTFLELVIRIELMTSSLPMTCSTDWAIPARKPQDSYIIPYPNRFVKGFFKISRICPHRTLQFVTVHLPPAVRSLFRRRAGQGVRAKLSEGVFAILGDSYAGFPGKSITKIP